MFFPKVDCCHCASGPDPLSDKRYLNWRDMKKKIEQNICLGSKNKQGIERITLKKWNAILTRNGENNGDK